MDKICNLDLAGSFSNQTVLPRSNTPQMDLGVPPFHETYRKGWYQQDGHWGSIPVVERAASHRALKFTWVDLRMMFLHWVPKTKEWNRGSQYDDTHQNRGRALGLKLLGLEDYYKTSNTKHPTIEILLSLSAQRYFCLILESHTQLKVFVANSPPATPVSNFYARQTPAARRGTWSIARLFRRLGDGVWMPAFRSVKDSTPTKQTNQTNINRSRLLSQPKNLSWKPLNVANQSASYKPLLLILSLSPIQMDPWFLNHSHPN